MNEKSEEAMVKEEVWKIIEEDCKRIIDLSMRISQHYENKINPELILNLIIELMKL